jgi:hypothetical protein
VKFVDDKQSGQARRERALDALGLPTTLTLP